MEVVGVGKFGLAKDSCSEKKRESQWGSILRGGTKVSELIPGTVGIG